MQVDKYCTKLYNVTMIKVSTLTGMTVGELKEALSDVSDNTPVLLENVNDRIYFKNNYERAVLPCDGHQSVCFEFQTQGESACANCYLAHTYTDASRVVKADNVVYIDISF